MIPKQAPFLLALLALLLLGVGAAHAGDAGSELFAFSLSRYMSGLATRSRVIQVAAVGMIIALVIIMKKFHEPRDS